MMNVGPENKSFKKCEESKFSKFRSQNPVSVKFCARIYPVEEEMLKNLTCF
jgi:hypothetical protein